MSHEEATRRDGRDGMAGARPSAADAGELVSIVVPVYNVERYLPRCLDSILAQSHANLEVIVVDDGSTDGSGAICERYAAADGRVKVVRRPNGGLSAARNTGMGHVTGRWVVFVDSDDYLGPRHVERLLRCALLHDAPVAVTGSTPVPADGPAPAPTAADAPAADDDGTPLTAAQAIIESLAGKRFASHAWGKIYREELFDLLEYPEGRLFEDQFVAYTVFHRAGRVAWESADDYRYATNRDGSISARDDIRNLDFLDALRGERAFVARHESAALRAVEDRYLHALMDGYAMLTRLDGTDPAVAAARRDLFDEIREHRRMAFRHSGTLPAWLVRTYAVSLAGPAALRILFSRKG